MKTKKCRPVLIEIDKSFLYIHESRLYNNRITMHIPDGKQIPQQLVLISLEYEKIEVNDICYYENNLSGGKFLVKYIGNNIYHKLGINPIEEYGSNEGGIIPLKSEVFKVIAIQDQLSLEYISKFVEQYNRGCVEDVEIEVISINEQRHINNPEYISNILDYQSRLNLTSKITDSFITIIEKKEPVLYTEEEVKEFVFRAYNLRTEDHVVRSTNSLNDWFDQNKKR